MVHFRQYLVLMCNFNGFLVVAPWLQTIYTVYWFQLAYKRSLLWIFSSECHSSNQYSFLYLILVHIFFIFNMHLPILLCININPRYLATFSHGIDCTGTCTIFWSKCWLYPQIFLCFAPTLTISSAAIIAVSFAKSAIVVSSFTRHQQILH